MGTVPQPVQRISSIRFQMPAKGFIRRWPAACASVFAGLAVAPFQKFLDLVFKGTLARRIGLNQISGEFVYNHNVVVLVKYRFLNEHRQSRMNVKGNRSEALLTTEAVDPPYMITRMAEP